MAKDDFLWWQRRLKHMAQYFSAYRIDHILGFFRIWEIPGDCTTGGVWGGGGTQHEAGQGRGRRPGRNQLCIDRGVGSQGKEKWELGQVGFEHVLVFLRS